jgi:hypothetical protein
MVIGKIDPVVTGKLQKLGDRKRKVANFEAKTRRKMGESSVVSEEFEMEYSSENSSEDQDIDDSYIQNEDTEDENSDNQSCFSSGPQNRNQYPELC